MFQAPITGRTVFFITASAFAVIIAVNVTMATLAVGTFPGLEVRNSYVASQQFEASRDNQDALGWTLNAGYERGQLVLRFTDADGAAFAPEAVSVLVGRSTVARDDQELLLNPTGDQFAAPVVLEPGKWLLRVSTTAPDGTPFFQRLTIQVAG
ncbi:hypothetical protein ACMU_14035 [Actibacterium mucosum KCTC 23349]|uniref:FixH protein n=1 Tax=Actibacterium mucosum KCTC 23349 TaxID=1454373 RepID=A0A037ZH00_9RHOB|nr:FixH family protein [Actibacterium mucosum]KAJ54879.1 hypothetical protein ACMU_14035 [Actibacterium mucosum KCTC 23349]